MDFGSILHEAQKNQQKNNGANFYKSKFDPPKKEVKSKNLSTNIQKFLAKKEEEERQKSEEARRKREELLAMRDEKTKNKIKKSLKVIKSANKSVLDDAVDNNNTALTLAGPDQPDEDDYGYVSQEASVFYSKMMEKYKNVPDEDKFGAAKKVINHDLSGTKDRVRAAILRTQEEENMPHKRKRKSHANDLQSDDGDDYKQQIEEKKDEKPKPKKVAPPPLDFNALLKIAEKKQFEPVVIETKKVETSEEPERLMTKKQKREYEQYKAYKEAKMRREQEKDRESNQSSSKKARIESSSRCENTLKSSNPLSIRIPKLGEKSGGDRKQPPVERETLHSRERDREKHKNTDELKYRRDNKVNDRQDAKDDRKFSKSSAVRSQDERLSKPAEKSFKIPTKTNVNSIKNSIESSHRNDSSSDRFVNMKSSKPSSDKKDNFSKSSDSRKVEDERRKSITAAKTLNNKTVVDPSKQGTRNDKSSFNSSPSSSSEKSKFSSDVQKSKIAPDSQNKKTYLPQDIRYQKPAIAVDSKVQRQDSLNNFKQGSKDDLKSNRPKLNESKGFRPQVPDKGSRSQETTPSGTKFSKPSYSDAKTVRPSEAKGKPINGTKIGTPSNLLPKEKASRPLPPSGAKGSRPLPSQDVKSSRPPPSQDVKGSRPLPPSNVKGSRPFPPPDVKGSKPFPPSDVKGSRPFPPSDVRGVRQFPPSDVRGPRQFPPRDMMQKNGKRPLKRQVIDDDSEYDSELDDFIDDGPQEGNDYSKYIQEIFGYDKSKYRDDDDDVDNMESNFSQVMREEFISKKIGLMEDLEDMRQEALEKKRKMQKKRRRISDD